MYGISEEPRLHFADPESGRAGIGIGRGRSNELLAQIPFESHLLHVRHRGGIRTERRLVEEPGCDIKRDFRRCHYRDAHGNKQRVRELRTGIGILDLHGFQAVLSRGDRPRRGQLGGRYVGGRQRTSVEPDLRARSKSAAIHRKGERTGRNRRRADGRPAKDRAVRIVTGTRCGDGSIGSTSSSYQNHIRTG